jgi:CubicO group peptidase (beta-lactamase class C family)
MIRCAVLTIFFLLSTILLRADRVPDFRAVDALIQKWVDAGYYPEAGIWIVSKDGKTLHERYWGGSRRDSPFMVASASKWLEAATMMTLVDEGMLNLDKPISTYLPEMKGVLGQNTLRQMFSHTSSLNSVTFDQGGGAASYPSRIVTGHPTVAPGERFAYGGMDLAIGWNAVERVTGKPWLFTFARNIAKPLGMTGTVTGDDLYVYQHMVGADLFPRSTAADYMAFLLMMLHNGEYQGVRVLSPAAIQEMEIDEVRSAKVNRPEYPEMTLGQTHHGIYGLGEWRFYPDQEGNAEVLTSPSFAGFIPWIDKRLGIAAVFAGRATGNFDAFHASAQLIRLTREAFHESP